MKGEERIPESEFGGCLVGFEPNPLEHLVCMGPPQQVLAEVDRILLLIFADLDPRPLHRVFQDVIKLFEGQWSGYQKCNTSYHDLEHTMDCFLAMARLIHGAAVKGIQIGKQNALLGLVSSLMHDTGYIQSAEDLTGTGAKYTLIHIERSIEFLKGYFAQNGYSPEDFYLCGNCLKCTGLDVKIEQIDFLSREHEILGKMLGTADLLGQMASPTYLERLPVLFCEFIEGGVQGFRDELDFLEQTPPFWEICKRRFATEFGSVDAFINHHFRARWGINQNLYREVIERHIRYLDYVLKNYRKNYREYLKRDGWMKLAPTNIN